MLQESCTDLSGSLVVYSTVDVDSIQLAMSGEDPSCIPLLPLGFFITPMELIKDDAGSTEGANVHVSAGSTEGANVHVSAGSLLTVGLQVLAGTVPSAKINLSSIAAINNHLCTTVNQISAALSSSSGTLSSPEKRNGAGYCTEAADAPEKQGLGSS
ncbi:homeobox-7, HOMEODOMAIN GLABROUS 5 [Hibiscus trionum]|uniref:Homeobox-7, HOMEODOMAIN GLABROUS 5 n=1 Tax=Hibiscus trionum TaxID=183268 RepID=A0A9W7JHD4_HIBTR|nr:homeobox-7, HOMEODOMAIN GLABROUS 5 [Hibiscus trionum]